MEKPKIRKRRKHGFEWPYHWQQVIAYVAYAINILVFYLMVVFTISSDTVVNVCLGILNGILLLILLVLIIISTLVDPSDPTYYECIAKRKSGETMIVENYPSY